MSARRSTKRARRSGSYRWEVEKGDAFDELAEMVDDASGKVFEGAPSQIIGTAERGSGRILGLKASYGPGETVTLRFRKDGSYSVAFGLRMTTKVRAK